MSTSTTGASLQLGLYSDETPAPVGGIPFSCKVTRKVASTTEAGSGQRKQASHHATNIHYVIDWKMKVQNFADFITSYAMITDEGELPSYNLYVDDGITSRGFTGCLTNTCQLEVDQDGALIASIQTEALANNTKSLTITQRTYAPMTKANISSFTIGSTEISKWVSLRWGINNNVKVVPTGNGVAMTEIFAQDALYTGTAQYVKVADPQYGFASTVKQNLIIATVDNADSPVSTTFKFASVAGNENDFGCEELDLAYENLSWTGDSLVIS